VTQKDITFKIKAQDDTRRATASAKRGFKGIEEEAKDADRAVERLGDEFSEMGRDAKRATDKAERGLTDLSGKAATAKTGVGGIVSGIGGIGAAVGAAGIGAAITKFIGLGTAFAEDALAAERFAQALGINVSDASGLSDALNTAGARSTTLIGLAKEMKTVLSEAAGGSKIAQRGLDALGVTVEELAGMSDEAQLRLLIQAIADADPTTLGTLMEVFGRGPVLELKGAMETLGAEGFDALVEKGKELGYTFTEQDVEAAKDLKLAMGELNTVFNTTVSDIMPLLIGGLEGVAEAAKGVKAAMSEASDAANFLFSKPDIPKPLDEALAGAGRATRLDTEESFQQHLEESKVSELDRAIAEERVLDFSVNTRKRINPTSTFVENEQGERVLVVPPVQIGQGAPVPTQSQDQLEALPPPSTRFLPRGYPVDYRAPEEFDYGGGSTPDRDYTEAERRQRIVEEGRRQREMEAIYEQAGFITPEKLINVRVELDGEVIATGNNRQTDPTSRRSGGHPSAR